MLKTCWLSEIDIFYIIIIIISILNDLKLFCSPLSGLRRTLPFYPQFEQTWICEETTHTIRTKSSSLNGKKFEIGKNMKKTKGQQQYSSMEHFSITTFSITTLTSDAFVDIFR